MAGLEAQGSLQYAQQTAKCPLRSSTEARPKRYQLIVGKVPELRQVQNQGKVRIHLSTLEYPYAYGECASRSTSFPFLLQLKRRSISLLSFSSIHTTLFIATLKLGAATKSSPSPLSTRPDIRDPIHGELPPCSPRPLSPSLPPTSPATTPSPPHRLRRLVPGRSTMRRRNQLENPTAYLSLTGSRWTAMATRWAALAQPRSRRRSRRLSSD